MIKLSQANVGAAEKEAVNRVIDNLYLGMGAEVRAFEAELNQFIDPEQVADALLYVATAHTGTSALQLAVQALGLKTGDEVLVPTITYVASFQAIAATGATPVAVDVAPLTACMNVEDAKKRLTPKTRALMYVHYASGYGDRKAIFQFAKEHGLRVIEDAAHSFGGLINGKRVGCDGDVTCFSFDGIKNITCGEGGAVVTRDVAVYNKVCDLRLLGVENDTEKRYKGQRSFDLEVSEQGWRYHLSNINAAIGRAQLARVESFIEKRQELFTLYSSLIDDRFAKPVALNITESVPHPYVVFLNDNGKSSDEMRELRNNLMDFLKEQGIETGLHYKPNHLLKYFAKEDAAPFPVAENLWEKMLTLPLHVNLSVDDVKKVSENFNNFFKDAD